MQLRPSLAFLAAARLVLNTGHRFVYPFLPAIARGLGISLERAGFLVSIRWLVGMVTPAVVASLGSGERRRRLIVLGLALFALGAAITAAVGVYLGALVGFMLMGLAKPVFDITSHAYVADRVRYESRARFLSVLEFTWAGGLLLGAPAMGWLLDRWGWSAPFWVLGALAAASVLAALWVLTPDAPAGTTRQRLRLDRSAVALLVVEGLFSLGAEFMFLIMGAWLEDGFGLTVAALGGTAVLIGLAELGGEGATFSFTDRLGKRRAVAIGLVVAAGGFGTVAITGGSLAAGMAAFLVGVAGFEFTIVSAIPLATEVQPAARARYLSWLVVANALARGIGAGVAPAIYGAWGVTGNAIAAAAANLAALALLLRWVRD
jgi:predicted MFS family arabinose efflux permease